ncbi:MAG TPA: DUF4112 domain-containing protein [Blastocatellia bacterium]|nr:DUF4112 domain-containing protein [Blastocatellia bacterium]
MIGHVEGRGSVKLGNTVPGADGSTRDSIERAPLPYAPPEALSRPPIDQHLERIALLMDRSFRIPGTDIRFGLDPVIGFFLPLAGDAIGAIISAYIVFVSVRYGLPKIVIARMVFNIAADFVVGSIPFLGDAADFVWKVNTRNLRLLNKYATGKRGSFWSDWAWVLILFGVLFLLILSGIALILWAIKASGVGLI